jgi:hypothetical protein
MEIIKDNDTITLKADETNIIEEYKFNEEINFSKLMEHLLKLNLSGKVVLEDKISDKTPEEENLTKLIKNIIDDYNLKVEELKKFREETEKK